MTIATDTVLDKLVEGVREDIASDKRKRSEADINSMAKDAPPTLDFAGALRRPDSGEDTGGGLMRVIAEVKQASPSQGRIAERFEPAPNRRSLRGRRCCRRFSFDRSGGASWARWRISNRCAQRWACPFSEKSLFSPNIRF